MSNRARWGIENQASDEGEGAPWTPARLAPLDAYALPGLSSRPGPSSTSGALSAEGEEKVKARSERPSSEEGIVRKCGCWGRAGGVGYDVEGRRGVGNDVGSDVEVRGKRGTSDVGWGDSYAGDGVLLIPKAHEPVGRVPTEGAD